MEFANPERLHLLYLLPVLVFLFVYGARKRRSALVSFTGSRLAESLAPGRSWRKSLLKGTLKTLGMAFLIVALAGPRFGNQLVKMQREGIDIVIALDTSLSMLAEDMKPNRLERAKQEIIDLIKGLRGDRVGLVAFAGDAFALCPLTVDYDAALMFVRSVDVDAVPEPGTAIGKAIEKSVALFENSEGRDKAIILVTDGESHEGDPVEQAHIAGDEGIKIYAIGIGNPAGELIPMRGTGGGVEGYKKDNRGETVLTRLDEATLQKVASASHGQYLPATRQGLELKVLYNEISGMNKTKIEGEFVERAKDRFPIFIALSFCFLLLDVLVIARGRKTSAGVSRLLHTGAARTGLILLPAALLLAGMLSPSNAFAKKIDRGKVNAGNEYYKNGQYDKALFLYRQALGDTLWPPENSEGVLYNEGNALYMMKKYQEALQKYQQSFSEDTTLTGRMLYNRGNTLLQQGQLKEAVESYANALRVLPDDADARHNLEVALRMLQQQQKQQQQQQQQDKQNDEQQQENQDQQQQQGEQDQQQQQQEQQQDEQDQQQQQQQQAADSTQMNPATVDSTESQPLNPEQTEQLSKEDAMRILKALEEDEKRLQEEKRKAAFKKVRRKGKDW